MKFYKQYTIAQLIAHDFGIGNRFNIFTVFKRRHNIGVYLGRPTPLNLVGTADFVRDGDVIVAKLKFLTDSLAYPILREAWAYRRQLFLNTSVTVSLSPDGRNTIDFNGISLEAERNSLHIPELFDFS